MPTHRTLQRLVLAVTLSLLTSLALAGGRSSSGGGNDDAELVAIILGLAIASSIDCAKDAPLICTEGGFLDNIFGSKQMPTGGQPQKAN